MLHVVRAIGRSAHLNQSINRYPDRGRVRDEKSEVGGRRGVKRGSLWPIKLSRPSKYGVWTVHNTLNLNFSVCFLFSLEYTD